MAGSVFQIIPMSGRLSGDLQGDVLLDVLEQPEDWRELWHPEEVVKMATLTAWHPCTADQVQP